MDGNSHPHRGTLSTIYSTTVVLIVMVQIQTNKKGQKAKSNLGYNRLDQRAQPARSKSNNAKMESFKKKCEAAAESIAIVK